MTDITEAQDPTETTDETPQSLPGRDWADAFNADLRQAKESPIRAFNASISGIPGILKLTLGEPDFATPDHVREAAERSLRDHRTHYAPSPGTPGLREAIAGFLDRRMGLTYEPGQVIVTEGAYEALGSTMRALLDRDSVLLVPSPYFGLYRNLAVANGARFVAIDTSDTGFMLSPERLDEQLARYADRRTVLLINDPCNPTGAAYPAELVRRIAQVVERHRTIVVSDEVYAQLTYGEPHESIARYLPDRTIVIDSTSKTYAMTGWRLGYIAAPEPAVAELAKSHQLAVGSASMFVMDAAEEAYRNGDADIDRMRAAYHARRDLFSGLLAQAGFDYVAPSGAFYLYVRVPDSYHGSSTQYATAMAHEALVACVPGDAFEDSPSRYIRFSYAAGEDQLREAARRIGEWARG
ncbi:aminotransferase class I/II-fold pyridoxal phosphate-dependent enzyme [Bifidobacterium amazonense]|uniref:Aminotransferase n=1 Tax=Bifidobacterium amazonense TaxID=2809027 RepID=A0ABS9VS26_9BIFI|nr:aminotransferase class I/II-fold pyridoxal phosphate-dependent enzyme [Bifidobacterium amazonense]MCH9274902.1 aminotransferase class I/II-fold pyridoxal phosphate-dependent enzyme [Bifidobacterium amazonense]